MEFVETIGKYCTFFGTAVCDPVLLDSIDERFEQNGADALILGQGPVLSLGFIDPVSMECLCPVRGAFAVKNEWLDRFGSVDDHLMGAAAAELAQYIKENGGRIDYAFDITVPYYEKPGADITDAWLTSSLLDFKLGDTGLRKEVVKNIVSSVIRYNSGIGQYSRGTVIKRIPGLFARFVSYLFAGRRVAPRSESMRYYDPGYTRGQAQLHKMKPDSLPKVSVVIRTHDRPEVLRKTLNCLYYQGYPNMEIIVVEDGSPASETMIKTDFADLGIKYHATGEHVGRSAAANIGFGMSTGEYINLLDDDDFLYPGHIIAGVTEAEATGADMIFLQGIGLETEIVSKDPYEFKIDRSRFMNFPRVDEFTMSGSCVTPDNGVLFHRDLFDKTGGMREELHANEDWSLWLKMMAVSEWSVVPYATNAFVNPASADGIQQRDNEYRKYRGMQFDDDTLVFEESPEKLRGFIYGKINDYLALDAHGQLRDHLQKEIEYWGTDISDDSAVMSAFEHFRDLCLGGSGGIFTAKDFNSWHTGMNAWLCRIPDEKRTLMLERLKIEISGSERSE